MSVTEYIGTHPNPRDEESRTMGTPSTSSRTHLWIDRIVFSFKPQLLLSPSAQKPDRKLPPSSKDAHTTMQPPPPKLIKYIPPSAEPSLLPRQITSIEVVAHEKLPHGGNHWSFYLQTISTQTDNDPQTVQLDVSPSYSIPSTILPGGSKAFLILSTNPHSLTPLGTSTKRLPLAVRQRPDLPSVQELMHLLTVRQHRHRYEFDDQGRGCRFWVRDQIPYLLDEGLIIDEEQAQRAREAILLEFPDGKEFPLTIGRYY
ncbi:hypothetical protein PRK78_001610 [Emydomyces testavorans]|uniref:DUF7770 domain-containing protein n=1 Tax=Emydomyces testavorans TaxID=2070801 RepID=A0AAF0IGV9_9EURO|nr:hypothetical protein PRK78_001610 [Emydomyces testavorans]